ncbi:hypothetical protein HY643_05145 [Candidatus Woesearchaeota archaeon]|nr:hypothetical protein [Candidatus Woesearchaeota archaeon]
MWWDKKVQCNKCNQQVPKDQIRADLKGNTWVCETCYQILKEKREAAKFVPEKKVEKSEPLKKFMCTQCKYSFESRKLGKLCPFCGRANTVSKIDGSLPW